MFDYGGSGTFEYSLLYYTRAVAPLVVCTTVCFELSFKASEGLKK